MTTREKDKIVLGLALISDVHGWYFSRRERKGGWRYLATQLDIQRQSFHISFARYENRRFIAVVAGDLFSPLSPFCGFDKGEGFCDILEADSNRLDYILPGNHDFLLDAHGHADVLCRIINRLCGRSCFSADNISADRSLLRLHPAGEARLSFKNGYTLSIYTCQGYKRTPIQLKIGKDSISILPHNDPRFIGLIDPEKDAFAVTHLGKRDHDFIITFPNLLFVAGGHDHLPDSAWEAIYSSQQSSSNSNRVRVFRSPINAEGLSVIRLEIDPSTTRQRSERVKLVNKTIQAEDSPTPAPCTETYYSYFARIREELRDSIFPSTPNINKLTDLIDRWLKAPLICEIPEDTLSDFRRFSDPLEDIRAKLLADALFVECSKTTQGKVSFALSMDTSIRGDLEPEITEPLLYFLLPFDNSVQKYVAKGEDIIRMLQSFLRSKPVAAVRKCVLPSYNLRFRDGRFELGETELRSDKEYFFVAPGIIFDRLNLGQYLSRKPIDINMTERKALKGFFVSPDVDIPSLLRRTYASRYQ